MNRHQSTLRHVNKWPPNEVCKGRDDLLFAFWLGKSGACMDRRWALVGFDCHRGVIPSSLCYGCEWVSCIISRRSGSTKMFHGLRISRTVTNRCTRTMSQIRRHVMQIDIIHVFCTIVAVDANAIAMARTAEGPHHQSGISPFILFGLPFRTALALSAPTTGNLSALSFIF